MNILNPILEWPILFYMIHSNGLLNLLRFAGVVCILIYYMRTYTEVDFQHGQIFGSISQHPASTQTIVSKQLFCWFYGTQNLIQLVFTVAILSAAELYL